MAKNVELEERILAIENEVRLEKEMKEEEEKFEENEEIAAEAGEADLNQASEQKTTPLDTHAGR